MELYRGSGGKGNPIGLGVGYGKRDRAVCPRHCAFF